MKNENYQLNYLQELEAESIHIIREAVSQCERPVMLYSIGKDSSVLLHLAKKAFAPGPLPFPLLHVDTGFKFSEMIDFRDRIARENGIEILVEKNTEPAALAFGADDAHKEQYIYHKKTKPLLEALKRHQFDAAFGGARRDEEKSRAKERVFSHRTKDNVWDPKQQRPELWHLYNAQLNSGESMRVFPLSNWTELDVWCYIAQEKIEIVPLYFAQKRNVVKRAGAMYRVDEHVQPKADEKVVEIMCRYRTLGCSPSTAAVVSKAETLEDIIEELIASEYSERSGRAIDKTSSGAMEKKKREGYF